MTTTRNQIDAMLAEFAAQLSANQQQATPGKLVEALVEESDVIERQAHPDDLGYVRARLREMLAAHGLHPQG